MIKKLFALSLSTKVLLGLLLGIMSGLFFGETLSFLNIFGEAFILLLQMALLPYIVLALVSGIGSLSYRDALTFGKKCGAVLLVLWLLTLLIVVMIGLSFPDWENASLPTAG